MKCNILKDLTFILINTTQKTNNYSVIASKNYLV